jgi:hypothetical protein
VVSGLGSACLAEFPSWLSALGPLRPWAALLGLPDVSSWAREPVLVPGPLPNCQVAPKAPPTNTTSHCFQLPRPPLAPQPPSGVFGLLCFISFYIV